MPTHAKPAITDNAQSRPQPNCTRDIRNQHRAVTSISRVYIKWVLGYRELAASPIHGSATQHSVGTLACRLWAHWRVDCEGFSVANEGFGQWKSFPGEKGRTPEGEPVASWMAQSKPADAWSAEFPWVRATLPRLADAGNATGPPRRKEDSGPEHIELTGDEKEQILSEIGRLGADPQAQIEKILGDKNVRVISFGESHSDPPMTQFGIDMMPVLAKCGITHLAMEMPVSTQKDIDEFERTGKIGEPLDDDWVTIKESLPLLQAARDAGIKIVAVDASMSFGLPSMKQRDNHMAEMVANLLDRPDSQARVVVWGGKNHHTRLDHDPGKLQAWRSEISILKDKLGLESVVSIAGETDDSTKDTLLQVMSGIQKPTLVPTRVNGTPNTIGDTIKDPNMRGTSWEQWVPDGFQYKNWDYLILFPLIKD